MTEEAMPLTVTNMEPSGLGVTEEYGYVDAELVPILMELPANPFGTGDFGVEQAREMYALAPLPDVPSGTGIGYRDIGRELGRAGPAMRIIAPDGERPNRPCIYWIHGGGFVLGSPFDADLRLFRWASEHDCVIVAVQYGLAPEHPFPQGLEDCYAGLVWTSQHADELGFDPTMIAVAGESAGGGLAAGLAMLARDRGEVQLCFQLLIYPMLDDRTVAAPGRADAPVWTKAANAAGWSAYLGSPGGTPQEASLAAAPARATTDDLRDLPPCFIPVGSVDLFRAEDIQYVSSLQDAGVPAELHVYAGAFHASDHLVPEAAISRRFERDIDIALGRAFARASAAG